MAVTTEDVTREMRETVADFIGIGPEELDLGKKLRLEYRISSIEAAELIMVMEDRYNLNIPIEDAEQILSTQDAIDYVLAHSA